MVYTAVCARFPGFWRLLTVCADGYKHGIIVLALTLDCGRTPQGLGRTCNPLKQQVLQPPALDAAVTSRRGDRVQTHFIQHSLALFSICALSHMNACVQNVRGGGGWEMGGGTRQRHKQTVDLMASQQLLHRGFFFFFGKQPLLAEPVNGLCNRTFPPRARVSKDAN